MARDGNLPRPGDVGLVCGLPNARMSSVRNGSGDLRREPVPYAALRGGDARKGVRGLYQRERPAQGDRDFSVARIGKGVVQVKVELLDYTHDAEQLGGSTYREPFEGSGVYMIRLLVDGRFYVGSSIDVKKRFIRHKKDLRRGGHHCAHLQRAWNKYGESNFEFAFICGIEKDRLLRVEQYLIDSLKPEFNSSPCARSPLGVRHSGETKAKVSAASKRMWASESFRKKHAESMADAAQKLGSTLCQ